MFLAHLHAFVAEGRYDYDLLGRPIGVIDEEGMRRNATTMRVE